MKDLFPLTFMNAGTFVKQYTEALLKYDEERPITRVVQLFMRRLWLTNSLIVPELLKSINVAHIRSEDPDFVFDEDKAFDQIFPCQLAKQIASITMEVSLKD
jgi:hypothetical protein